MRLSVATTAFLMTVGACTTRAQTARTGEYRITPRDTSIHPVYTGFDITLSRATSGATSESYPVIVKVDPDSPATKAGLKVGDEILSVNGMDLGVRRATAWYRGPDIPAKLRVRRDTTILEVTLVPVKPLEPARKP